MFHSNNNNQQFSQYAGFFFFVLDNKNAVGLGVRLFAFPVIPPACSICYSPLLMLPAHTIMFAFSKLIQNADTVSQTLAALGGKTLEFKRCT